MINDVESQIRVSVFGDLVPTGQHAPFFEALVGVEEYEDVLHFNARHDLRIVNLECPLSEARHPIRKVGPHLHAPPKRVEGIRRLGFNLASLANNHIKDMGEQAIAETLSVLGSNQIGRVGAGMNLSQARATFLFESGGLRLAVLAIAENEFSIASEDSAGANPVDLYSNYLDIHEARKACDFLLIIYHGGNEFSHYPNPEMQKTCRLLVEFGANAVVCHHSHVISGYEQYRGAPIFYGLGNFVFHDRFQNRAEWDSGYAVSLCFSKGSEPRFSLHPFVQNPSGPGVRFLKDEARTAVIDQVEAISEAIGDRRILSLKWAEFVQDNTGRYMSALHGHNRIERFLAARGIPVFWKSNPRALRNLTNYFRCEAHSAFIREMLRESFEGD